MSSYRFTETANTHDPTNKGLLYRDFATIVAAFDKAVDWPHLYDSVANPASYLYKSPRQCLALYYKGATNFLPGDDVEGLLGVDFMQAANKRYDEERAGYTKPHGGVIERCLGGVATLEIAFEGFSQGYRDRLTEDTETTYATYDHAAKRTLSVLARTVHLEDVSLLTQRFGQCIPESLPLERVPSSAWYYELARNISHLNDPSNEEDPQIGCPALRPEVLQFTKRIIGSLVYAEHAARVGSASPGLHLDFSPDELRDLAFELNGITDNNSD